MRLEVRVIAWMAVLLGAAAALSLGLMARFEASRMENQWTEAGLAMAQATENTLEVSMLNDAPEDVRQAVRNVQRGQLVEDVSVYGRSGELWVRSDPSPTRSDFRQNALMVSMQENRSVTIAQDNVLSVFVPIPKQQVCSACHAESSAVLGAVEVRLDEQPFRSELASSARTSLFVAAIPLLLGILLSVSAIRRKVLQPLAEVDDAVERLGGGDLSTRLPAYPAPEFDEVADTFNDMAARLERQARDVRATVETLRSELTVMEEVRAMLAEGAGLPEVLERAAAHLGAALKAT
ncbi:MAG: HAMP domain-containing protein, partial [Actinomycetota bacterium]